MSKIIQLQIPKPCHEDWGKMTPAEKGKFCSSCQKQVIDFSSMSDREIAIFFKKPSTGSVCGRFMTDQLDRDLEIPRKRIPWVKYFFQFLLPGFLISMKATAQGKVEPKTQAANWSQRPKGKTKAAQTVLPDSNILLVDGNVHFIVKDMPVRQIAIEGKVMNEQGEGIPYASVDVDNVISVADSLGNYKMSISIQQPTVRIKCTAAGYFENEISIEATNDSIFHDITLKANNELHEVVVMSHDISRTMRRTTGLVCKIVKEVEHHELKKKSANEMNIYPNPILSNSTLHIEWKQTAAGDYNFQIFNNSGQLVFKKQLYIDADARVLSIDLPSLTAGTYFIKMTNRSTSKSYTAKVVVQ